MHTCLLELQHENSNNNNTYSVSQSEMNNEQCSFIIYGVIKGNILHLEDNIEPEGKITYLQIRTFPMYNSNIYI